MGEFIPRDPSQPLSLIPSSPMAKSCSVPLLWLSHLPLLQETASAGPQLGFRDLPCWEQQAKRRAITQKLIFLPGICHIVTNRAEISPVRGWCSWEGFSCSQRASPEAGDGNGGREGDVSSGREVRTFRGVQDSLSVLTEGWSCRFLLQLITNCLPSLSGRPGSVWNVPRVPLPVPAGLPGAAQSPRSGGPQNTRNGRC